ncbi:unnamed protein product [Thlaspi arvense]|uniref:Replication factor A C-terminal domain-containing protein n=1 Tax=Thlaspi arvense TaxID=13288 RepID=A0AAU9SGN5_THLAR|nr:unnamed protein product [Thlaspi arvense]
MDPLMVRDEEASDDSVRSYNLPRVFLNAQDVRHYARHGHRSLGFGMCYIMCSPIAKMAMVVITWIVIRRAGIAEVKPLNHPVSDDDLVGDDDRCFDAECDEHGGSDSDESLSDEESGDDSAADSATVDGYISEDDWYYIGCNRCNKNVEPCEDISGYDGPPLFDCLECKKDVSDVVARYRIIVHVSDLDGDEARFMLFDSVAETVLGISTADLAKRHHEEYLFKIGVGVDNLKSRKAPYIVDIMSSD